MKPLHGLRWRRRIRSIWTRLEQARHSRRITRGVLAGIELTVRVAVIHVAARRIMNERRIEAQRRALAAMARINAQHNDELRKAYGSDAIDV